MNVSVKRAFLWVGGPWLLYSPASSHEMSPFPLTMILYAAYPDSVSHRECVACRLSRCHSILWVCSVRNRLDLPLDVREPLGTIQSRIDMHHSMPKGAMCRKSLECTPLVRIRWVTKASNGGSGARNMKQKDLKSLFRAGRDQEQGALRVSPDRQG